MSATPPDTPYAPQRMTAEERTETLTEVKRQAQALFERTEVKRSEFMSLGKAHKEELIAAMAVEAQMRSARDLALQRSEKTRLERESAELQIVEAEERLGRIACQTGAYRAIARRHSGTVGATRGRRRPGGRRCASGVCSGRIQTRRDAKFAYPG